jgi:hypothetical protein
MKKLIDILSIGSKLIDKLIADPEERNKAKLELLKLEQSGEFREDEMRYEAIVSESKSEDKWTSRARPAFMYVIYIYLLSAIPFGIIAIFAPQESGFMLTAMGSWFRAIPDQLYTLFGAGFLGYVGARSYDKKIKKN